MKIHLIDGTYELFRHYFALPSATDAKGQEIAATRGVLASVLSLIESGATHVGVATDHVVESFRNELYAGYKTSEGVPDELLSQFPILENMLAAMGVVVWPETYFEADDALASAALKAAQYPEVDQVLICTPDKDLAQCVSGTRIEQLDRRRNILRDEAGAIVKFWVKPASIPDWLAVVGDTADGYPGLRGWGEKAAAAVLSHYPQLEAVPRDWTKWHASIRKARPLSETLFNNWSDALLFRKLATLRRDASVFQTLEELRWTGPREGFEECCRRLNAGTLLKRAAGLKQAIARTNA